jgi:hypothetical protein
MAGHVERKISVNMNSRNDLQFGIKNAIEAARKFLEQYHSPVIYKSAYLRGKNWIISMEVGLSKEEIIEVEVDTETRKILGYNHQTSTK